jgi:GntR family transcriptional regulator
MTWSLDRSSPLPLHAQLERRLREMTAEPAYRAGGRFPDELTLAKELGISRNTVRTAIEALVREGLLVRQRGVGTHVAQSAVASLRTPWDGFLAELEPRGGLIEVASAESRHEPADPTVAHALGLDAATVVLCVERLLRTPDGPHARVRSWFHPRVRLGGTEDFRRPLYDLIERDLGIIPTQAHEEVSACAADTRLARLLAVRSGAALLVRRRIVLDSQERPIELAIGWYAGPHARRQVQLRRDHQR